MAGRRIALIVAYGPEARAFLQSGLAERLSGEGEALVVTPRPESAAFHDCPFQVLAAPAPRERASLRKMRAWSRGARRRLPSLGPLTLTIERSAARILEDGTWARFLRAHDVGMVIAASASGQKILPALQAAANIGAPSTVLSSSWKDPFLRPELPAPVTALGLVAATGMPSRFGSPRIVRVLGSLHQAAVRRAAAMPRRDFCGALGLDPSRPIVLYATGANDEEEPARLHHLADALERMSARPQLLIRTNPMDDADGAYSSLAVRPDVALMRPLWEWSRSEEWNCPLPADLPWWRGALEHAAVPVSLPSTLALDCAAWGKPTVNLAWGRGAALWAEQSYETVKRNAPVVAAASLEDAAALIGRACAEPPEKVDAADPAGAAVDLVREARAAKRRALPPQRLPSEAMP
jgi:hypothetical protein